MLRNCEKCGAEYDAPNHLKYCPDCSRELKKTRWRKREQKTCAVCGKSFETDTGAACCSTACSRVYARRVVMKTCEHCGREREIRNDLRFCDACAGTPADEEKKRLTTDIAVYFMALHGYALKEAAQELHMSEQSLQNHLRQESETTLIEKLTAYYTAERQKRAARRMAAARVQI